MTKNYAVLPHVLAVAGLDPTGLAGIAADVKTLTALGVNSSAVISANTCQTEKSFYRTEPVKTTFFRQQLKHLFQTLMFDAVKVGMLYSAKNISVLAKTLKKNGQKQIILDPVIRSSSGGELIKKEALVLIKEELLPAVTMVTPNIMEAEALSGISIHSPDDLIAAGEKILAFGPDSVLIKGGHSTDPATDILISKHGVEFFRGRQIAGPDFRGTGCVLSSAIAAFTARGHSLIESVIKAKQFLEKARSGYIRNRSGGYILNTFTFHD